MVFAFVSCDDSSKAPEEPDLPEGIAINTLEGLKNAAKTEGKYYLAKDIVLDEQLTITADITLDGNGKTITRKNPTPGADAAKKAIILISNTNATLKNLTVTGTNPSDKWNEGEFAIKVAEKSDVTLENVKVTKSNAGIQVQSSNVTLKGKIDVSGNIFGGIGVDQETGNEAKGKLIIAEGTEIICSDEKVPAIWLESTEKAEVTGIDNLEKLDRQNGQIYYLANNQNKANFIEGKAINNLDELKEAATKEGAYYLANDIAIPEDDFVEITVPFVLDGNSKTLTVTAGEGEQNTVTTTPIRLSASEITIKNAKFVVSNNGHITIISGIGNDNTIKDCTFSGEFAKTEDKFNEAPVSRGIVFNAGSKGFTIDGNDFSNLRQPAYLEAEGTVSNNTVSMTRGWVVCVNHNVTFKDNSFGENAVDIAVIPNNQTKSENYSKEVCIQISENNNGCYIDQQLGKFEVKDGKIVAK